MVSVMYGFAHDRSGKGNDAQQIGLVYEYFLSKATSLYAAAGLIDNNKQGVLHVGQHAIQRHSDCAWRLCARRRARHDAQILGFRPTPVQTEHRKRKPMNISTPPAIRLAPMATR